MKYSNDEVLLLTDQAGSYYAIPVSQLQAYLVPEEQKEQVEQIFGADVEGYVQRLAAPAQSIMWDPPIFGGKKKDGVGIDDPSMDPGSFARGSNSTVFTFVGTILRMASAASMVDFTRRIE